MAISSEWNMAYDAEMRIRRQLRKEAIEQPISTKKAVGLHGGEILLEGNEFKIFLPHYTIMGIGYSLEQAARSALTQLAEKEKGSCCNDPKCFFKQNDEDESEEDRQKSHFDDGLYRYPETSSGRGR